MSEPRAVRVSCDGKVTECKLIGRQQMIPHRIDRATSRMWEISTAVYVPDGKLDDAYVYRETHWQVPTPHVDLDGLVHREKGVYYDPEWKPWPEWRFCESCARGES